MTITKKVCDICGKEMDSKYLKEHYNYEMDFTGSKPDLSYQMGDGSWVTPSIYYSDVKPIHLDLCSGCGSKFLKEMENVLESMKTIDTQ